MATEGAIKNLDVPCEEGLLRFKLNLPAAAYVDWKKGQSRARMINGYKQGVTLEIPRATRSGSGEGRIINSNQAQSIVQRFIPMKIEKRYNSFWELTDHDMTYIISPDFMEEFMVPGIEHATLQADIYMTSFFGDGGHGMGTPGSELTWKSIAEIHAKAQNLGHPTMGRKALVAPEDVVAISDSLAGSSSRLNTSGGISNIPASMADGIIKRLYMGTINHYDLVETTNLPDLNNAALSTGTPLVNGANQRFELGGELATDGWPNSTKVLNKGQYITIDGVHTVSPNKTTAFDTSDSGLQWFVVMEDVTSNASGQANIKLGFDLNDGALTTTNNLQQDEENAPATASLAAYQNVSDTPDDNAMIKIVGQKSNGTVEAARYRKTAFFVKDAVHAMAGILQPLGGLLNGGVTDPETGLTFTMATDSSLKEAAQEVRFDTMLGAVCANPEGVIIVPTGKR